MAGTRKATKRALGQEVDFSGLPPNEADRREEVLNLALHLAEGGHTLGNYARYEDLKRASDEGFGDEENLFDNYWVKKCVDASTLRFHGEDLINIDELVAKLEIGVENNIIKSGVVEKVLQQAERAEFVGMDYFNRDKVSLLLHDLYLRDQLAEDAYYGAQQALDFFESNDHWERDLTERMGSMREAHVIIGDSVYRLIDAADRYIPVEEDEPKEETKKEPAKGKSSEELAASFGVAEDRIKTEVKRAGLQAQDPEVSLAREGVRYLVKVNSVGALEGSESYLTFDFGTSLAENMLDRNWDQAYQSLLQIGEKGNLAQVVWNYQGNQMVGTVPEFWEKMLTSIADLQDYDARPMTTGFGAIDPDEQEARKLQDWILNVAQQMAEHGVGAESYANHKAAHDAVQNLVVKGTLPNQYWEKLKTQGFDKLEAEGGMINLNQLYLVIQELIKKNEISTKSANDVAKVIRELDKEPSSYFEKDKFLNMIQQGHLEGVFTEQEVANVKKAMETFASDTEWQNALRLKIEKDVSLTVPEEEVIKAVDAWSSEAGYNIEAGVQMTLTDEDTILAAIAAPFPFFYTFDTGTPGKLTLQEAAMVFFDREVFTTPDKGTDAPTKLLMADVVLATALKEAVQFEMGKTTSPQAAETFANKLSTMIVEHQKQKPPPAK